MCDVLVSFQQCVSVPMKPEWGEEPAGSEEPEGGEEQTGNDENDLAA